MMFIQLKSIWKKIDIFIKKRNIFRIFQKNSIKSHGNIKSASLYVEVIDIYKIKIFLNPLMPVVFINRLSTEVNFNTFLDISSFLHLNLETKHAFSKACMYLMTS